MTPKTFSSLGEIGRASRGKGDKGNHEAEENRESMMTWAPSGKEL